MASRAQRRWQRPRAPFVRLSTLGALLLLAGCAVLRDGPPAPSAAAVSPAPTFGGTPKPPARGGGYYLDDGPGDNAPANLDAIPDAVPRREPAHRFANKPYNVFGRDYVPLAADVPYRARGIASWYGRKFHGQKTSSGEPYDMYGMTAAHPTLPIPSYVRVSNPANGRTVVVRVNDRGPFHAGRLIDLSYTAAWKLGYVEQGSTLVEVERLLADGTSTVPPARDNVPPVVQVARPVLPTTILTVRDDSGTYLQLGAFGNRDNAESFLAHLARELARLPIPDTPQATLDTRLRIHSAGLWHRVQLGPWPSADSARRIADLLQNMVGAPDRLSLRQTAAVPAL